MPQPFRWLPPRQRALLLTSVPPPFRATVPPHLLLATPPPGTSVPPRRRASSPCFQASAIMREATSSRSTCILLNSSLLLESRPTLPFWHHPDFHSSLHRSISMLPLHIITTPNFPYLATFSSSRKTRGPARKLEAGDGTSLNLNRKPEGRDRLGPRLV